MPDAPVTKFTLEMQGGKKGLIVNSTNICKGKHHAKVNLKGQNGRRYEFNPVVKAQCKKNGWKAFPGFKNQGDCVSYVATKGKNKHAGN